MNQSFVKTVIQRLAIIWRGLVEPAPSVAEPDQRRQAQLLAGLLVSVVPLGLLLSIIPIVVERPGFSVFLDPEFQVTLAAVVFSAIAYAASRTRYYKLAAVFVLNMGSLAIFAAAIPDTGAVSMNLLIYVILPILLASALLSLRAATIIAALNLAGVLLFAYLAPELTLINILSDAFSFVLLASIVVLLIAYHRNLLEADRRALLAQNEARLRQITDNMRDMICQVDMDGIIQYASPSFMTVLGYPPELLIGRSVFARVHPDDVKEAQQRLRDGVSAASQPFEHRAQHADGHYLWLEAVGSVLKDGDGVATGAIISSRDISERKAAETALRQAEQRLRTVISSAPVVLFAADEQGLLTVAEGQGLERMGLTQQEVLGRRIVDIYPDEPEVRQLARRATAGETFNMVVHFVHRALAFEVLCAPLKNAEGAVVGVTAVASDVTERERAEANLRQQTELLQMVFDHIPVMVVFFGEDGEIHMVNREYERTLGWTLEEVRRLPNPIAEFYPDPNVQKAVRDFIAEASSRWQEFTMRVRNGRTIETLWANVRLSDGRSLGIGQNITERKLMEQRQFETAVEKERADILQKFLGDASHDLRTPLTIIKTSIYLLRRLNTADKRVRHLDILTEQSDHLQRLLDDFLSMARLNRAGAGEFNFEPVGINGVLHNILVSHEAVKAQRQQHVVFTAGADLPPLLADEGHLKRALSHLVANALNYTPEGGKIAIQTFQEDDWLVVRVRDTGVGINAIDLPRIFDPFFRADKSRNPDTGGMGLGLAIVQRIVTAHGGRVEVESTVGEGSVFSVWLPLVREMEASVD